MFAAAGHARDVSSTALKPAVAYTLLQVSLCSLFSVCLFNSTLQCRRLHAPCRRGTADAVKAAARDALLPLPHCIACPAALLLPHCRTAALPWQMCGIRTRGGCTR
jgi:hypothetical protein